MTSPTTAEEALAEIEAALAEILRAQKADDHAATAAGYQRRADAWAALYRTECDRYDVLANASPEVLCALLRSAIPGAAVEDRRAARDYRGWAKEQGTLGAPAA